MMDITELNTKDFSIQVVLGHLLRNKYFCLKNNDINTMSSTLVEPMFRSDGI